MKAENATTSCEEMSVTCEAVHRSLIRTQLIIAWKKPKCTNFIMNDDHGCVCVADPLQIVWENPTRKPCCIGHVHFPDYVSFIKPARVFKGLGVLHLFQLLPVPTLCIVCVCPCCACLHCVYAMARRKLGEMSVIAIALILPFFLFDL